MKRSLFIAGMFLVMLCGYASAQKAIYQVANGGVRFHSDAPLEFINATSNGLIGAVDIAKRTFLFKISIPSFDGFNSPRQKEHFNENYMESDLFPIAVFSGKIIEEIDLSKEGEYSIRAKGKLLIHGVGQQRTIKCRIVCENGKISVRSDFVVLLADHNIKIPRIVSDKLSPEINVSISAELISKPSS
jgi:hypothetical protein